MEKMCEASTNRETETAINPLVKAPTNTEAAHRDTEFCDAVVSGLCMRQKAIPPRFLYDVRGSELFEEITRVPEYYPTRTEVGLLKERGAEIRDLVGRVDSVVEFGSGSSTKTPLLLEPVTPTVLSR